MRNVATCSGIELNPIDLKKEKKNTLKETNGLQPASHKNTPINS